jgi:hypothetical protein
MGRGSVSHVAQLFPEVSSRSSAPITIRYVSPELSIDLSDLSPECGTTLNISVDLLCPFTLTPVYSL